MGIPGFIGTRMRDQVPTTTSLIMDTGPECGIVNLHTSNQPGSHWTCYWKRSIHHREPHVYWFDSYGDLGPPEEWKRYFAPRKIFHNKENLQSYGTEICGHLCFLFLVFAAIADHDSNNVVGGGSSINSRY